MVVHNNLQLSFLSLSLHCRPHYWWSGAGLDLWSEATSTEAHWGFACSLKKLGSPPPPITHTLVDYVVGLEIIVSVGSV